MPEERNLQAEIEKELGSIEEVKPEEKVEKIEEPTKETEEGLTESVAGDKKKEPKPEPEFDVDGEKVKLSQIKEWKAGYMKDADYRRKTARVAEEWKKIEWLTSLDNYLRANPHIAAKVNKILQGEEPSAGKVSGEGEEGLEDDYAKSIVSLIEKKFGVRLDKIEKLLASRAEEERMIAWEDEIEKEVAGLSSRYKFATDKEKNLFERMILQAMLANPDTEAKELGDKIFQEISEVREGFVKEGEIPDELRNRVIEEYRKSKKSPPVQSAKGEIVTPGPEKLSFDDNSLEKAIKEALEKSE